MPHPHSTADERCMLTSCDATEFLSASEFKPRIDIQTLVFSFPHPYNFCAAQIALQRSVNIAG